MGRDKRFLVVDGQPLLARAIAAVAAVCRPVTVVVADAAPLPDLPDLAEPPRVVVDTAPGEGPLAGLITALDTADTDVVLVVAGDHPQLMPDVLRHLVEVLEVSGREAVLLGDDDGRPQPLVGAYRRSAVPALRAAFANGERRAGSVVDHLDVLVLPPDEWRASDPAAMTLRDLDTPEDVEHFTAELARIAAASVQVTRLRQDGDGVTITIDDDRLGREEPLRVRAAGPGETPVEVVTTMRSPGNEAELAVGWLFSEGLYDPRRGRANVRIGDPRELSRPEDTVTVSLPHPLPLEAAAHRHTVATASCGVCGRASIDELAARCPPLPLDAAVEAMPGHRLLDLPDRLRTAQSVYAVTGGVHATGLFDRRAQLLCLREDVGRHNALDAAIGARLLDGRSDADAAVAVLSGRIGFELVAKAAVARIPIIVAVGAPTDLAVRTADRLGVTLLGFVRGGRGNVYTHAARVAGG